VPADLLCARNMSVLSVNRWIFSNSIGGMWVYYRQVALLKESYLLSSLLASSAGPYFLPACLLRGRGRRLLGDDT
jgi:hypothetical protein